ncbi:MAG: peptide deformylase [Clostridia bacterium]|nr:peptide deformylase [Clostridia bacterium]
MVRPIIHDPLFLAQKSEPATTEDLQIVTDLMETLQANRERCVGMAANMIGEKKRIIAFYNGPILMTMLNPKITGKTGEYETEEGCLSLSGVKKTKRYQRITVSWQDQQMRLRTNTFQGFTAQIIQHEIDHCEGKLI